MSDQITDFSKIDETLDFHHYTEEELEKIVHVKRVERTLAYEGAIVDLFKDKMELPNGEIHTWDLVHHRRGAAAVLPVLPDGRILLIRQYRPALDRWALEVPAGTRDSLTEDTFDTATRELREETGYAATSMTKLMELRTTVAFCDEFIDVYLAEGLHDRQTQDLDDAEVIRLEAWTVEELTEEIFQGRIQDSKTVSAILGYARLRQEREGVK